MGDNMLQEDFDNAEVKVVLASIGIWALVVFLGGYFGARAALRRDDCGSHTCCIHG